MTPVSQPVSQKEPTLHSVGIQVNGTSVAYTTPVKPDASTINVRRGDHVKWNCDHGNFTVLFEGDSPFADAEIHGHRTAGTALSTVIGKKGSYKYVVTVARADGEPIVDDPEIIIDGD